MSFAEILLVGGGLAAQRCAEILRSRGFDGRIRMVCAERRRPYDRPPLSKGVPAGDVSDEELHFRPRHWYVDNEVELILGRRAVRLDPHTRRVELDEGTCLEPEQILIATGAAARTLPMLGGFSNALSLRTLDDARRLRRALAPGVRLVLIGAGFIGQEIAATARRLGAEVTIVEALPLPLAPLLGSEVARHLAETHADEGVALRLGGGIAAARGNGAVEQVELSSGERVEADLVVVGVGVAPATDWLDGAELGDPEGIRTDPEARTGVPGVFAAGDVARPHDPWLGAHARAEHWEAASRQGSTAALAMLGEPAPRAALPSFWSDQYGLRIQYAGHANRADSVAIENGDGERSLIARYSRGEQLVAALAIDEPRAFAALRRELEASNPKLTSTPNPNKGAEDGVEGDD